MPKCRGGNHLKKPYQELWIRNMANNKLKILKAHVQKSLNEILVAENILTKENLEGIYANSGVTPLNM